MTPKNTYIRGIVECNIVVPGFRRLFNKLTTSYRLYRMDDIVIILTSAAECATVLCGNNGEWMTYANVFSTRDFVAVRPGTHAQHMRTRTFHLDEMIKIIIIGCLLFSPCQGFNNGGGGGVAEPDQKCEECWTLLTRDPAVARSTPLCPSSSSSFYRWWSSSW